MADLAALEKRLKTNFGDRRLLEQAIVHASYLNENPDFPLPCNERLEFLGDAVLGLVVAHWLFHRTPHLTEGEMTRLKAASVRREALAEVASKLGLGRYLKMGKGEEASGGRQRPANLANVLEAVVAALFVDSGFEAARAFVLRVLGTKLSGASKAEDASDYKSRLQELAQARFGATPAYRVAEETGPPHRRHFRVQALIGEETWGVGEGPSKKGAEMEAARKALRGLE